MLEITQSPIDLLEPSAPVLPPTMPPGAPYHSFALPYPIRVDNFTDTLDDLPPPFNRPRLHLLTHTHSDHIAGLASKSFAHRVICSPDAKEMLLRHEVYAERSLHDHQYRAEKKKTFAHLKVDPYVMPNGQKLFTGSRDLLVGILTFFSHSSTTDTFNSSLYRSIHPLNSTFLTARP